MSIGRKKIIPRRTIKPADVRASDWTTDQIRKQTAIMKIERGTAAKPARQTAEFRNDFDIEIGRVLTFLFSVFSPFFRAYRTAESWRTIGSTHPPSEFVRNIFHQDIRISRKSICRKYFYHYIGHATRPVFVTRHDIARLNRQEPSAIAHTGIDRMTGEKTDDMSREIVVVNCVAR